MKRTPISNPFTFETTKWLGHWLSGGKSVTYIPHSVRDELLPFHPDEPVILYRSVTEDVEGNPSTLTFPFFTSWTYDLSMAENFSEKSNRPIISAEIHPDDILADTTMINPRVITKFMGGFPDEQEVIVSPGTYQVIWIP